MIDDFALSGRELVARKTYEDRFTSIKSPLQKFLVTLVKMIKSPPYRDELELELKRVFLVSPWN